MKTSRLKYVTEILNSSLGHHFNTYRHSPHQYYLPFYFAFMRETEYQTEVINATHIIFHCLLGNDEIARHDWKIRSAM